MLFIYFYFAFLNCLAMKDHVVYALLQSRNIAIPLIDVSCYVNLLVYIVF